MKLALLMIVKDEEANVGRAIESVKDIVDEIVVVDTGSVDQTPDIAEKLGANVHHFKWTGDYSAARNACLEKAGADWVLWLDADEMISKTDHAKIKELINQDDVDGYYLIQRNYCHGLGRDDWTKAEGEYPDMELSHAGFTQNPALRLFRRVKGIKWEGSVRENVEPDDTSTRWVTTAAEVVCHHYGYAGAPAGLIEKRKMHIDLAREKAGAKKKDPQSWFELGTMLFEAGEWEECIKPFTRAFKLDSNYLEAMYYVAMSYFELGKMQEAWDALEKLLKREPSHAGGFVVLAGIERLHENFDDALAFYDKAIAARPDLFSAWYNKATLLLTLDKADEASECFEKTLALMPDFMPAMFGQWQNNIFNARFDRANDEMLKWLKSFPELKENLIEAVKAFISQEKYDLVSKAFGPLIEVIDNAESYMAYGTAQLAQGNVDEAEESLIKAIKRDGSLNDARLNLAQIQEIYRNDPGAALALYEIVLQYDPENEFCLKKVSELGNEQG
ncbi:Glycosyl transferase, group 2 family protein [hydrothermal vent metagenome]|uniref:Glycosyl transferase, group 2 family protein n=1 Tax=hydrothermal vent metagenome TaxID=652676 RepID=A0A3B1BY37_9ZZZZ